MKRNPPAEAAAGPEAFGGKERRIAVRIPCDGFAEVVIPATGYLFRGEIADLSEFGCYIKSRARLNLKRSAEAELRFTVNGEQFSVSARVAGVRANAGVGFEFSLIEPSIHKNLLEIIDELQARQPIAPA